MMRKNGEDLVSNWLLNSEIEILSDNEEINIDSIEELNDSCYDTEIMTNEEKGYYHNLTREQLNKLLKAVKQINNKLKEK